MCGINKTTYNKFKFYSTPLSARPSARGAMFPKVPHAHTASVDKTVYGKKLHITDRYI